MLISVTTIPAAANIGVAAAYEDWPAWRGSVAQLAINLVAMCVAGIGTLVVQRVIFPAPRGALRRNRAAVRGAADPRWYARPRRRWTAACRDFRRGVRAA